MANEALVHQEGAGVMDIVRTVTVADATAITQGTLLVFEGGSRTAIAHTAARGATARPAGYAVEGKDANDGKTTIGVQRSGVVKAYMDSIVTTGDLVRVGKTTANRLERVDTSVSALSYQESDAIVGRALENIASGSAGKIALTLM